MILKYMKTGKLLLVQEVINFSRNLDRAENTTMIFSVKQIKDTALDFSQEIALYCKCAV